MLGDEAVLGFHEIHEFQEPSLSLVPLVLFEGDLLKHRLVFDVAFDLHEALAAVFDALLHVRHFHFRVPSLGLKILQLLEPSGMGGFQLFQGCLAGLELFREPCQPLGDLLDHLVYLLNIDEST